MAVRVSANRRLYAVCWQQSRLSKPSTSQLPVLVNHELSIIIRIESAELLDNCEFTAMDAGSSSSNFGMSTNDSDTYAVSSDAVYEQIANYPFEQDPLFMVWSLFS